MMYFTVTNMYQFLHLRSTQRFDKLIYLRSLQVGLSVCEKTNNCETEILLKLLSMCLSIKVGCFNFNTIQILLYNQVNHKYLRINCCDVQYVLGVLIERSIKIEATFWLTRFGQHLTT